MTTRDPHINRRARRAAALAALQPKPRVVARSRSLDRGRLAVLVGLAAAAAVLALALTPSPAAAKFGSWTCYNMEPKPQSAAQGHVVPQPSGYQVGQAPQPLAPQALAPQPLAPVPQGAYAVMPSAVVPQGAQMQLPASGQQSFEALPLGHRLGQAYSTPGSHSGTPSGLGVMINGVWYPEPDVSRYFYYVEVPGDASVYCLPNQVPVHASGAAASQVVPPMAPQAVSNPGQVPAQAGLLPNVPAGYPGAPGTVFQPLVSNP